MHRAPLRRTSANGLRKSCCMFRLTAEAIEDLEESDYDGDWNEGISRINEAFVTGLRE